MGKEYCVNCKYGNLIEVGLLHKSCNQCRDDIDEHGLRRETFYTHLGTKGEPFSRAGYGIVKDSYDIAKKG